ncbi:unnamed protein product [Nyctereutes procyonoides]|uniref:(raccoon dog) hypothetical protein n=1 Tax=Nyctereutes procyonoides TaxID=34880 RepID=A0A811ZYW1_NYCPR|nr:unnamed protein product [Nyctereutes procyonoides]
MALERERERKRERDCMSEQEGRGRKRGRETIPSRFRAQYVCSTILTVKALRENASSPLSASGGTRYYLACDSIIPISASIITVFLACVFVSNSPFLFSYTDTSHWI